MSVGSTESWARLRLVQGESTAQAWELVASLGQTTLTVGSGPQSTWQVRADGVRPIHLTFHWDGGALRVADLGASGDVRVDGAAVDSNWVGLTGHARLEFGAAVLMVDTSAPRVGQSDHPLDPAQLTQASASADPALGAISRLHKATLLGVAASEPPRSAKPVGDAPVSGAGGSAAPEGMPDAASDAPGGGGDFRLPRASDSERMRKATLLGVAVSTVPPAKPSDTPPASVPPASTPSRGLSTGTLMGVVNPLDVRFSQPSSVPADKADARTIIGMPMADATVRSTLGTAATQTDLRPLSVPPASTAGAAGQSIASTWQEDAGSARPSLPDIERDPYASGARPVEASHAGPVHGSPRPAAAAFEQAAGPRALDAPKRSFPLQYIGIVVLTGAAYFAWLYLLDHW